MTVEIIAECGVNHNGDVKIAHEMISAAKDCGADTVKFQLFDVNELVSPSTTLAKYQQNNTGNASTQNELLEKLSLSLDEHQSLIERCNKIGIN